MEYIDCSTDHTQIKYHVTFLSGQWDTMCEYHLRAALTEEQTSTLLSISDPTRIVSYFVIETSDDCGMCLAEYASYDADKAAEERNERYLSHCW